MLQTLLPTKHSTEHSTRENNRIGGDKEEGEAKGGIKGTGLSLVVTRPFCDKKNRYTSLNLF